MYVCCMLINNCLVDGMGSRLAGYIDSFLTDGWLPGSLVACMAGEIDDRFYIGLSGRLFS